MTKKGPKGTLVWDEGANRLLQSAAIKAGFGIINIPRTQKGVGLPDKTIIQKYGTRYIIVTQDYAAYQQTPELANAVGFIEIEPCPAEKFTLFKRKLQNFLQKNLLKQLKYKVHRIPIKGKPYLRINLKNQTTTS